MSDLFTPPRYSGDVTFHRHTDRSVTWLELFYDLVYVATFIQIGNFLSDNLTLVGFGQFLVLTAVVWWAWTGVTFYSNQYYADDLVHRAIVFFQIFAIAGVGLSVSKAFGELSAQFVVMYVLARLALVILYVRSAFAVPAARDVNLGAAAGSSIAILIWLSSLLLPEQWMYLVWLVGVAVEFAIPLLPSMRQGNRDWPVDRHHATERFGIMTIIVLGESFVKVLDDSQGTAFGLPQILFSTAGFIVLFSLWWLYFSDAGDKSADYDVYSKAAIWVYAHLPLSAGLIAFGVGAKKLYGSTLDHPEDAVNPKYRLLYMGALTMYLVALTLIDYGLEDSSMRIRFNEFVHLIAAALVVLIGVFVTGATAITFVWLMAIIMGVQVLIDIFESRKEENEEGHAH